MQVFKKLIVKSALTLFVTIISISFLSNNSSDAATATRQTFSDVPPLNSKGTKFWAYAPVEWGVENGIVKGYKDGIFKPNNNVTQAEFLTMLINAYVFKDDKIATEFSKIQPADKKWDGKHYTYAKVKKWNVDGDVKNRYITMNRGRLALIVTSTQGFNCSLDSAVQMMINDEVTASNTVKDFKPSDKLTRAQAIKFIKDINDTYDTVVAKGTATGVCPKPGQTASEAAGKYDEQGSDTSFENPSYQNQLTIARKLASDYDYALEDDKSNHFYVVDNSDPNVYYNGVMGIMSYTEKFGKEWVVSMQMGATVLNEKAQRYMLDWLKACGYVPADKDAFLKKVVAIAKEDGIKKGTTTVIKDGNNTIEIEHLKSAYGDSIAIYMNNYKH